MPTESLNGEEGIYMFEVQDSMIVRQIFVFGSERYWAARFEWKDDRYMFTDQPEHDSPDPNSTEISKDEFDREWNLARTP